jgi:hypothetical protein
MNRDELHQRLDEYLDGLQVVDETAEGYADNLVAFSGTLRKGKRGGARAGRERLAVKLPTELQQRQDEWLESRLRRLAPMVENTRVALGFSGVPYPNNIELANEMLDWATGFHESVRDRSDLRAGRYAAFVVYCRAAASYPSQLTEALENLRPPIFIRTPLLSEEESREFCFGRAVERLVSESERVAGDLGCPADEAGRWILAGVSPKSVCIRAGRTRQLGCADIVTIVVNPHVVTPEELRTVYRRLRRVRSSSVSQLLRFLSPILGNLAMNTKERLKLWNELYPLHRYKNEASFRVASSHARRDRATMIREAAKRAHRRP